VTAGFAPQRRLNAWLYRRGVRQALLRNVLRFQITVCLVALAAGLIVWPVAAWVFWIGMGAALSVWNFFSLTKIAPLFIVKKYTLTRAVVFFLRSQGRLLVTIAVFGMALVWCEAPIWALLAGFSTSLVGTVWSVLALRISAAQGHRYTRSQA